jgi:crossover junction endodeoxyribonuclease RuvC
MTVIGLDPGVAPSAAIYSGPEDMPAVFAPMGVARQATKDGKKVVRTDPDTAAIIELFDRYKPDVAVVELVGVISGQGLSSGARFMHAAGLLEGIALARGCRLLLPRPQLWRKAWGLPEGKDFSRQTCLRLFPNMVRDFKLKNSHNQADALLLAIWGWASVNDLSVPKLTHDPGLPAPTARPSANRRRKIPRI